MERFSVSWRQMQRFSGCISSTFLLFCNSLVTARLFFFFQNARVPLVCVHGSLVPAIKDQHEAVSQTNRFVSSASRSPGGPNTGPCGPWHRFRQKEGGQKQGVTGNC